jgi:hypothetical protein
MDIRDVHVPRTCSIRHAAWICSLDMQHEHAAWKNRMDMQHGLAAWTCSKNIEVYISKIGAVT